MPSRVVSTRATLPGTGLDRLAAAGATVVRPDGPDRPEPAQLRALVEGADALVCLGNDTVDAALLDAAGPALQVVALASMGYDGVDTVAASARGVVVTHTPGVLAETTADIAFALILMARRRLVAAVDALRAGEWEGFRMDGYLGLDVHGATLGLVGHGQIGRAVERRARGFGMDVVFHNPGHDGSLDLAELLACSDVVSLHLPLTPTTHHLIGAAELATMKPTATLVNTSRGGVLDQEALLAALAAGELHSAGLDVFEREPLGSDVAELVAQQRLVTLPHIGSATEATRAAMVDLAADNVLDVLHGVPARTPVPGTNPFPGVLAAR